MLYINSLKYILYLDLNLDLDLDIDIDLDLVYEIRNLLQTL